MDSNDCFRNDDVFTLSQLLGGEYTLVIPDMQRDYCWGNKINNSKDNGNKIALFVTALANISMNRKEIPLGLIYGYEEPKDSRRILIIDGQQRITTLYLLIGMLYRRTPTHKLRQLLISDYELADNCEPRLQYQMRGEAMFFMSDLVTNFFLDRNGRLSQLEKSNWYYSTYDSDPTIQSFINAIRLIDKALEEATALPGWDFNTFADFVTDRIYFMYHDLGTRKAAEDMFITINTTVEPLTYAQSIKSQLIAGSGIDSNIVNRWEEMEQWAWLHRDNTNPDQPQTSDRNLERFLRLWLGYNDGLTDAAYSREKFDDMYRFFCAYCRLMECVPEALTLPLSKAETPFLVQPTIAYIMRWSHLSNKSEKSDRIIREFWDWLWNITRYMKVTASGTDTKAALKIVQKMQRADITAILDVKGASDRILNNDERTKLTLLAQSGTMRREVYEIMTKAQSLPLLNGKLQRIVTWCTNKEGFVDIDRLANYVNKIDEIWGNDIECNPELDDLRRVLLTFRHHEYPIVRRGETCLSLCWHDYDWQRLMTNAPGLIRTLIDHITQMSMTVRDYLQYAINRFNDRSYPYYFLISSPQLISRIQNRMLLRPCNPFLGFYLQESSVAVSEMRWFVEQKPMKIDYQRWSTIRAYGARCLYTDNRQYNISIDLYYQPDEYAPYRLEVFARDESDKPRIQKLDIPALLQDLGWQPHYDKRRHRHYITLRDARNAVDAVHHLSETLKNG